MAGMDGNGDGNGNGDILFDPFESGEGGGGGGVKKNV